MKSYLGNGNKNKRKLTHLAITLFRNFQVVFNIQILHFLHKKKLTHLLFNLMHEKTSIFSIPIRCLFRSLCELVRDGRLPEIQIVLTISFDE